MGADGAVEVGVTAIAQRDFVAPPPGHHNIRERQQNKDVHARIERNDFQTQHQINPSAPKL
jgi:hypothetical protein